nr:MAG: hypothetical protein CM15mV30_1760 [uncultured marine virus]
MNYEPSDYYMGRNKRNNYKKHSRFGVQVAYTKTSKDFYRHETIMSTMNKSKNEVLKVQRQENKS